MVDILSSLECKDLLRPVILCMELSQMLVQGVWGNQSPLLQLPYITRGTVEALKDVAQVEDIADFMNMEDDQRAQFVSLSDEKMLEVANVCNRYPNLELSVAPSKGSSTDLDFKLVRSLDPGDFETKEEF